MVCLGVVTAPHGVHGEVRIRSFTERPEDVVAYGDLYDEARERRFRAQCCGMVRGSVVAKLEGVEDRDAAEKLRGLRLHVPRAVLPATDAGEYYHVDLIGLRAEIMANEGGDARPLGQVSAVEDFGAGPVLEIAIEGKRPVTVPFTREVVPVVDLDGGRIGIAVVPGLLDAEPEPAPPGRHPHPAASRAPPSPATRARARARRSCRSSPSPYGRGSEGMADEEPDRPAAPWTARVLTLFPEIFPGPLGISLSGQALARGRWRLETLDIRAFASDKHATVDDAPFGGGPGMVMRADVVDAAIAAGLGLSPVLPLVYLTPRGRPLDQARVKEFAAGSGLVLLCGRYEGIDERVVEARRPIEISLGDFVLAGGDVAAMVLIEACVRLLPGVIGEPAALAEESFEQGLLEYPQYTRPRLWQGREVPEVLLSGDHGRIARWRREEAERLTRERRPDLWARYQGEGEPAGAGAVEGRGRPPICDSKK